MYGGWWDSRLSGDDGCPAGGWLDHVELAVGELETHTAGVALGGDAGFGADGGEADVLAGQVVQAGGHKGLLDALAAEVGVGDGPAEHGDGVRAIDPGGGDADDAVLGEGDEIQRARSGGHAAEEGMIGVGRCILRGREAGCGEQAGLAKPGLVGGIERFERDPGGERMLRAGGLGVCEIAKEDVLKHAGDEGVFLKQQAE